MDVTARPAWPNSTAPSAPSDRVTSVGSDGGLATGGAVADNRIATLAAFCRAIVAGHGRVTAATSCALVSHLEPLS